MAVAALIVYVAWIVIAFGIRTLVALRSTGDSGFRGLSGKILSVEGFAGVLFAVALCIGVAAPFADLAGVPRVPALDSSAVSWLGLIVAGFGVALTFAAQLSMGNSWRIGVDEEERTDLVVDGAFSITRNPIFSAMVVTAIGLVLMVPNALGMTGLVCLIVALELQVRFVEEPYLRRVHGGAYDAYAQRVGRFAPAIGRVRADALTR